MDSARKDGKKMCSGLRPTRPIIRVMDRWRGYWTASGGKGGGGGETYTEPNLEGRNRRKIIRPFLWCCTYKQNPVRVICVCKRAPNCLSPHRFGVLKSNESGIFFCSFSGAVVRTTYTYNTCECSVYVQCYENQLEIKFVIRNYIFMYGAECFQASRCGHLISHRSAHWPAIARLYSAASVLYILCSLSLLCT